MFIHNKDCSLFVIYTTNNKWWNSELKGIISEKKNYIHKWVNYNTFEEKLTKIPNNAIKYNARKEAINTHYCGNLIIFDIKKHKINPELKNYKYYRILDNDGDKPFMVYYNGKEAIIYMMEEKKYYFDFKNIKYKENFDDNKKSRIFYTKLVKKFKYEHLFVGKSYKNPMTKIEGTYGKRFDGNNLLFYLGNKKYISVGWSIYSFTTEDKITIFHSPLNDYLTPFPFAVGEKYVYLITDAKFINRNKFNVNVDKSTDLYSYFHSLRTEDYLTAKTMKNLKLIQKKL